MVLMAAMLPSGDAASFGKHKGGCTGSTAYAGCTGGGNSCHGGGGFLGMRNRSSGCNGGGFLGGHKHKSSGCSGYAAPAPACGCCGTAGSAVPAPPVVMPQPMNPVPVKPKTTD
jgi:hypothetical protein